jgi:hypothetical protein
MLDFATLVVEHGRAVAEQRLENEVVTHLGPRIGQMGSAAAP